SLLVFTPHLPPPSFLTFFPYTTLFRSHLSRSRRLLRQDRPALFHRRPGRVRRRRQAARSPGGAQATPGAGGRIRSQTKAIPPFSDRKSTRLNSSHVSISYAVFCLKKKN